MWWVPWHFPAVSVACTAKWMDSLMLFPVSCWEKERTFEINDRALARFAEWLLACAVLLIGKIWECYQKHAARWELPLLVWNWLRNVLHEKFASLSWHESLHVAGGKHNVPTGVWNPRELCPGLVYKVSLQSRCFPCLCSSVLRSEQCLFCPRLHARVSSVKPVSLGSCPAGANHSLEKHLEGSPFLRAKDYVLCNVFFLPDRDYGVFSLAHMVSALSSSFPSIWNTGLLDWKKAVVEMWAMFWSFLSSLDTKIETKSQVELWRVVHHSKLHCVASWGQWGMDFSAKLLALTIVWAHFCKLVHSRTAWTRLHQVRLLASLHNLPMLCQQVLPPQTCHRHKQLHVTKSPLWQAATQVIHYFRHLELGENHMKRSIFHWTS